MKVSNLKPYTALAFNMFFLPSSLREVNKQNLSGLSLTAVQ